MEEIALNRHDLLLLSSSVLANALTAAQCIPKDAPEGYRRELAAASCPAIVRRQEDRGSNNVDVGFSSPRRIEGLRCRYGASVPASAVLGVLSPYDVMDTALRRPDMPGLPRLREVCGIAAGHGIRAGLFGSYAMEAVTGLPYVSGGSDLDLLLSGELPAVRDVFAGIEEAARRHGVRTDIELRTKLGYDVKAKELLAGGQTVLGKSLYSVELLRADRSGDHISISLPDPPEA